MNRPYAMFAAVLCSGLMGCGAIRTTPAGQVGADVVMHAEVASPPNSGNIQRRFQLSHSLKALAAGPDVHIYTGQPWNGKTVTLYYIPSSNFVHDTTGYDLRSMQNLQWVGTASIQKDGLWTYRWHVAHERTIPKREMFLLARSDTGEYAIAQIQHFTHHRY